MILQPIEEEAHEAGNGKDEVSIRASEDKSDDSGKENKEPKAVRFSDEDHIIENGVHGTGLGVFHGMKLSEQGGIVHQYR